MNKYSDENKKPLTHPESIVLNHVVLMAQQSLDPEGYDMFCKAHDRIVENRHLPNEKLDVQQVPAGDVEVDKCGETKGVVYQTYFPGTLTYEQRDCLIRVFNNIAKAKQNFIKDEGRASATTESVLTLRHIDAALSWSHALIGVEHFMYRAKNGQLQQCVFLVHKDIPRQYRG